jgi:hypothetical protein
VPLVGFGVFVFQFDFHDVLLLLIGWGAEAPPLG